MGQYMKRRLSVFVGLLAVALLAQPAMGQGLILGAKSGFNRAKQVVENGDKPTPISGFVGGVYLRWQILEDFGIQPEILISRKGGRRDTDILVLQDQGSIFGSGDNVFDRPMEVMYIEVPLLAHLALLKNTAVVPYAVGGPALAIEIDCHDQLASAVLICQNSLQVDPGLIAGGGLDVHFKKWLVFTVEARHTWGLADINAVAPSVQNRTWSFTTGLGIKLR